ncbi:MAG: tail fiber domain-containing protein, partial [Patescibacteria group bacterium]
GAGTAFAVRNDGNVGIGTSDPGAKLYIEDGGLLASEDGTYDVGFLNGTGAQLWLTSKGSNANQAKRLTFTGNQANPTISFWRGDSGSESETVTINPDGNVGIGTSTATFTKLHVDGLTNHTGNVALCHEPSDGAITWFDGTCGTSSIKYKENVADLSYGLAEVMQLRPVMYNYKSGQRSGRTNDRVGLIAEEIFPHIPEVVQYNEDGSIQGIDYPNLTAINIRAIQEQQTIIASNTTRLSSHSAQLSSHARLHTDGTLIVNGQGQYQVTAASGSVQESIISAAKATSARLIAGLTNTRELVVQQSATITNLDVTNALRINGQKIGEYITGIVQSEMEGYEASGSGQVAESEGSAITASDSAEFATLSVSDRATVAGTLSVSGKSSLGSLLADEATISGTLYADEVVIGSEEDESGEPSLIVRGTSRMDQLEAKMAELEQVKAQTAEFMDATVSGTLFAERIDNFDSKIDTSLRRPGLLESFYNPGGTTIDDADPASAADTVQDAGYDPYNTELYATSLADLALEEDDVVLGAAALIAEKYLIVNGTASISQGVSTSQLTVGGLHLSDGIIEYMPAGIDSPTLAIQPSGSGKLDLLAGLMTLEAGQVTITGDVRVAGQVEVEETLLTNLIQPREFGNPFQVQVAGVATESGEVRRSRFEIIDESGEAVASFDSEGYAQFRGGIGIGNDDLRNPEDNADQDGETLEITTDKSSGVATLPQGFVELTIHTEKVTENSLVYITPRGSTKNQVLYIKEQEDELFIVGIDSTIDEPIEFNWWVVN